MENVKELLAEKLIDLSKGITADEKIQAMESVGISRPTLDKYLTGDIVKIDTATTLLEFLNKTVQARINLIRTISDDNNNTVEPIMQEVEK
jgi:hypothetical protein